MSIQPGGAKFEAKRKVMADRLADVALSDGLNQLSLRRAAKSLATSDRMLIYYFGSTAAIVHAVLVRISERQSALLAQRSSGRLRSAPRLLEKAGSIVSDPKFVPFMRVWAEVISRGSRGEEPYETLGAQTIERWLSWLETRLAMPRGKARRRHAAAILTLLLGATLLEMSQKNATRGIVKVFGRALRCAGGSNR